MNRQLALVFFGLGASLMTPGRWRTVWGHLRKRQLQKCGERVVHDVNISLAVQAQHTADEIKRIAQPGKGYRSIILGPNG